jgi:hypothetical protein
VSTCSENDPENDPRVAPFFKLACERVATHIVRREQARSDASALAAEPTWRRTDLQMLL